MAAKSATSFTTTLDITRQTLVLVDTSEPMVKSCDFVSQSGRSFLIGDIR